MQRGSDGSQAGSNPKHDRKVPRLWSASGTVLPTRYVKDDLDNLVPQDVQHPQPWRTNTA